MAKLKRSELRAHLMRSVQLLRGSLSYSSSCYLILVILFFNHAVESPFRYGTLVPGGTLLRRKTDPDEDEWDDALSNLEAYLPRFRNVLTPALKQGQIPDHALAEIQGQIDHLQTTTGVFSSPDSFSYAYEYWIEQLATLTVKRGVSFFTQRSLVRLMVELLKPREGMSIYDPSVGTGGTLVESARYVEQQGGSPDTIQLVGREKSPDIWAICKMNMLAHGLDHAVIEQGDSLQASSSPSAYDLVLQELPLSPHRRSGQLADVGFLRHAVQSLAPNGKAAILCPSSIAQHDHPEFWRFVLSRDWLEAVISLPPQLLQGTPSGACLFVFNRQKPVDRLSHVLFIQAAPDLLPRSRNNPLPDDAIQTVVQTYEQWNSASSADARVVPIQQIEEQNYRLNVDRYLEWVETPPPFNVNIALSRYRAAVQKRDEAVDGLMKALERLSYAAGESSKDGISSS